MNTIETINRRIQIQLLVDRMLELDLLARDPKAIEDQMNEMLAWNDQGILAFSRVIARMASLDKTTSTI